MHVRNLMTSGQCGVIKLTKLNLFKTDLKYSADTADDEMFTNFYKTAFPDIYDIEFCEDLEWQKRGIDKILWFRDGTSFTVDEKKRRVDYGDIAIELYSDYDKKKPGWLFYSDCDYIVYAIMPSHKVYLLPTVLLRRAWFVNEQTWLRDYHTILANNPRYRTQSICVPANVLLAAITDTMSNMLC